MKACFGVFKIEIRGTASLLHSTQIGWKTPVVISSSCSAQPRQCNNNPDLFVVTTSRLALLSRSQWTTLTPPSNTDLVVILHQLDDHPDVVAVVLDGDDPHDVGRVLRVRVGAVFVGQHQASICLVNLESKNQRNSVASKSDDVNSDSRRYIKLNNLDWSCRNPDRQGWLSPDPEKINECCVLYLLWLCRHLRSLQVHGIHKRTLEVFNSRMLPFQQTLKLQIWLSSGKGES